MRPVAKGSQRLRELYPSPSSPAASAVMQANRGRDTKPEVRLRSALHRLGLRFRKGLRISTASVSVRPDIVFTKLRVAVFVDGCFWHSCPVHGTSPRSNSNYWIPKLQRNTERDAVVNEALSQAGWRVIRVWEHEDVEVAAERIAFALSTREP